MKGILNLKLSRLKTTRIRSGKVGRLGGSVDIGKISEYERNHRKKTLTNYVKHLIMLQYGTLGIWKLFLMVNGY